MYVPTHAAGATKTVHALGGSGLAGKLLVAGHDFSIL
jgi:hypothetical protein